jgi:hypothetical protein
LLTLLPGNTAPTTTLDMQDVHASLAGMSQTWNVFFSLCLLALYFADTFETPLLLCCSVSLPVFSRMVFTLMAIICVIAHHLFLSLSALFKRF